MGMGFRSHAHPLEEAAEARREARQDKKEGCCEASGPAEDSWPTAPNRSASEFEVRPTSTIACF